MGPCHLGLEAQEKKPRLPRGATLCTSSMHGGFDVFARNGLFSCPPLEALLKHIVDVQRRYEMGKVGG